jgi:hypothetical protein
VSIIPGEEEADDDPDVPACGLLFASGDCNSGSPIKIIMARIANTIMPAMMSLSRDCPGFEGGGGGT